MKNKIILVSLITTMLVQSITPVLAHGDHSHDDLSTIVENYQTVNVTDGLVNAPSVSVVDNECVYDHEHTEECSHGTVVLDEGTTGKISTTIRFDYNDLINNVKDRNIYVTLIKDEVELGIAKVDESTSSIVGYPMSITAKSIDGDINVTDVIGQYFIEISGLPTGLYALEFNGLNHVTYKTDTVELIDYSKHVLIGTGDGTFTYGDVHMDGKISNEDLDVVKDDILKGIISNDLNGDGKVNIVDLSMISIAMNAQGDSVVYDTTMIDPLSKVDIENLNLALNDYNLDGEISNLFIEGNEDIINITTKDDSAVSPDNPIIIPIALNGDIEMSQIEIVTPSQDGAIQSGFVDVVYQENGEEYSISIPFDQTTSEYQIENINLLDSEISVISTEPNVIVINLGLRVVVKSITVTVEQVEGTNNEFVAIQEVVFVKDIIPEYPDASNAIIENIKISANNKSLTLTWDKADNVGGYRIRYGTVSGKPMYTKETTVNSVTISGLENLTKYYITIEATSGSWTGKTSDEVVGIPQPSSKPGVPSSIVVTPGESILQLSWQAPLNADTYNIYLKETSQADSEYKLVASDFIATNYTLKELTNNISYSFMISSSNMIGEGNKSTPIEATPEKFVIVDPILPTTDRIDNSQITSAWLNNSSNVNSSGMSNGFNASYVYDEDYYTYWMASSYALDSGINFTFEDSHDMSYMIYVPRLDGATKTSYLNVASFTVRVWSDGDDLSTSGKTAASSVASSYRLDENGTPYYIIQFNNTYENVVKLCVYANERTGAGRVNLSEAVFYDHSSLANDVENLFANDSFTQINSSVTEEMLQDLETRIEAVESYVVNQAVLGEEIKLARALLNNEEDALGYIVDNVISINTANDDRSLSNISPLGIVGLARTDLSIYADIPDGESIYLYPSQYFAGPGTFAGTAIKLESGRNIVNVEDLTNVTGAIEGGAYYYTYTGNKGDEITLHVLNYCGVYQGINTPIENIQIPTLELYDLGNIETANQAELQKRVTEYVEYFSTYEGKTAASLTLNPVNSTDISTRSVLLSVPASEVWNALGGNSTSVEEKVNKLINALLAWDELIYVTHTAYGDDEYERQGRQNIRYMKMSATAFMYAAGNHIGIQYGSTASVVSGTPTSVTGTGNSNNLYGWGIAHEIGHNLDRLGILEVTNNIYSQLALTWDGVDGIGLTTNRIPYEDVFAKVSVGSPGVPNNVFLQLGMYWQLHLAYSDENILEFYTAFNKAYKNGSYSNLSGYNRTAAVASSVAKKDLTDFFTSWGIVLSDDAKDAMSVFPKETRKIQYLTDNERIYRLTSNRNGLESIEDFTVQAGFYSEDPKELSLEITHNINTEDLQGFEIYRDGVCVGFTTTNTFKDYIGSYNNAAFTYSVQAVDKLGYTVGKMTTAPEVRIEYDDVVDSNAYTVEKINNGFRYTFKEATTTSGIIIENAPTTGNFDVSITSQINGELTSAINAKSGNFEINETLTGDKFKNYFIKPGADLLDRTIGIYDAKIIEVTGISDEQDVQFIASVGDNVAFTDYMVGILGHDFDTGNGILKAGDIIVIGEYIGDPYFNEIVMQGVYASSSTVEVGMDYIERPMAGTTYMFAAVPENGVVSVISDGLFIFKPDIQNESDLQGLNDTSCGGASLLPAQMKAIMNRTSDTGTRQTSATTWVNTPTYDSMPTIILQ